MLDHMPRSSITQLLREKLWVAMKSSVLSSSAAVVKRLWEQMELAKAQQAGTQLAPPKFRTIAAPETDMRKQVEVFKRVKQWWFVADSGKLMPNTRYGARLIELAKGKSAIEMASAAELLRTLELIKKAVEAGELDTQVEAAANKLREGFGK